MLAYVDGVLVPQPVNINSVNALLGLALRNESEMDRWLASVQAPHLLYITSYRIILYHIISHCIIDG